MIFDMEWMHILSFVGKLFIAIASCLACHACALTALVIRQTRTEELRRAHAEFLNNVSSAEREKQREAERRAQEDRRKRNEVLGFPLAQRGPADHL
jgi:hypothetical protein